MVNRGDTCPLCDAARLQSRGSEPAVLACSECDAEWVRRNDGRYVMHHRRAMSGSSRSRALARQRIRADPPVEG